MIDRKSVKLLNAYIRDHTVHLPSGTPHQLSLLCPISSHFHSHTLETSAHPPDPNPSQPPNTPSIALETCSSNTVNTPPVIHQPDAGHPQAYPHNDSFYSAMP